MNTKFFRALKHNNIVILKYQGIVNDRDLKYFNTSISYTKIFQISVISQGRQQGRTQEFK